MQNKNFEVDVLVSFKHSLLRQGLVKLGWTQKQLAEYLSTKTDFKIRPMHVSRWVCFRDYPKKERVLEELESLLGYTREDLFPAFMQNKGFLRIAKTFERRIEVTSAILASSRNFLPALPSSAVLQKEQTEIINQVLETLTPREALVVRLRFGFMDNHNWTLSKIAKELGIGKERVRQILEDAFRKLRSHKRGKILRECGQEIDMDEIFSLQMAEKELGRIGKD